MGKILQLVYDLNCGGVEAFVTNLNSCEDVFDEPFDFLLFTYNNEEQFFEKKNRSRGSKIIKIIDDGNGNAVFRFLKRRKKFYDIVRNGKYEIVHIHKETVSCMVEAIIAKMAGAKKVIVHSHNTHVAGTGKRAVIEKKIHYIIRGFWPLIADYMCACSSEAGNWLFGRKNVEKGKVEILKNGIIGTQYYYNKNTRNEYREKLGWQNNLIVGHVGRFSEQKNHTFLIDVIAEMYKVNPSVRAVLFGIGDLKNDMEEKVEQLGLKSIIKFPGTSPEINKYLQAMDLFLFPSLYEGLPVVGIEAQAAGIWVLASDTISPELKITDKVHWMSLSKPASCWAEKGLELLNQVSERDTALEIKEAGYDIEFTAKRLKDIYES